MTLKGANVSEPSNVGVTVAVTFVLALAIVGIISVLITVARTVPGVCT